MGIKIEIYDVYETGEQPSSLPPPNAEKEIGLGDGCWRWL
jgi:hypothetical protein